MNHAASDPRVPRLAPSFRFQWEQVQNCHVILYPEGMVKLSASAGEIMKRCDGKRSVDQIVTDLETAFPGVELRADVNRFLEEANEHGWIRFS